MRTSLLVSLLSIFLLGCVATEALAQRWVEITPTEGPVPSGRTTAGGIYDPVDHRIVLFGGSGGGFQNDVWEFDLRTRRFTLLHDGSGTAPAGRNTPVTVYDPDAHAMVIHSGQGTVFFNDSWSFDLGSNTWTELMPGDPKPAVRYGSAGVYDPVAKDLVMYAGFTNQGRFEDTWRLSLGSPAWTDVSMEQAPRQRCLHTASYDAAGHRMIMYGGQRSGALGDIHALDLTTDTWTNITPPERPLGRFFPAHVHDPIRRRSILFGGNTPNGRTDEVVAFDLATNTFETLEPSGPRPTAREGSVGVYIPGEDRMIVIGGRGPGFNEDVWMLEDVSGDDAIHCRVGNVNLKASAGEVTDVLFVNGSAGVGDERTVTISETAAFELAIASPPSRGGGPAPCVVYAWAGDPNGSTVSPLPQGVGLMCMSAPPATALGPMPSVIYNSIGRNRYLGTPTAPSSPAPTVLASAPSGVGRRGTFFAQGIILDEGSLHGAAAVTNGIQVISE